MSRLGFDKLLLGIKKAEQEFFHVGIDLAKKEFDQNFNNKSDKGDEQGASNPWSPLIYRKPPPDILQLTGRMREATNSAPVQYGRNFALFIINPIDDKGRSYAEYHHTGTSKMAKRRTVVQSNELDLKQLTALKNAVDRAFDRQGTF